MVWGEEGAIKFLKMGTTDLSWGKKTAKSGVNFPKHFNVNAFERFIFEFLFALSS